MILAIDFDGTLVDNDPVTYDIAAPRTHMIEAVKRAKEKGHILILWTSRINERLEEAIKYCASFGLYFDYHNENCPVAKHHKFGDGRKIYADFYLENKALTTWEQLLAIVAMEDIVTHK